MRKIVFISTLCACLMFTASCANKSVTQNTQDQVKEQSDNGADKKADDAKPAEAAAKPADDAAKQDAEKKDDAKPADPAKDGADKKAEEAKPAAPADVARPADDQAKPTESGK